ncbi:MAG: metallophosphoesterase family protein [Bacteroidaceae bacterium]|nr:metallophosphoesterase family protein [Prevotellaceae bacterium]MDY5631848.1 metallophosphoesterase family protein [Bacteroidaceae bacterium]
MKRIGLLSDTHAYWDPRFEQYFRDVDEIWHAGDIGSLDVVLRLQELAPLRAVHGNIDGGDIRRIYPELLRWDCEGLSVLMTHIGGYPGRYAPNIRKLILQHPPGLFISGHSHILKVMPDPQLGLLHINPGAAGLQGWQTVRTLIRFSVSEAKVHDLEVIELV